MITLTPDFNNADADDLEQAHLAYLRGDLAKAQELLKAVLAAEPDNPAALTLYAQVLAKQAGQTEETTLALNPASPVTPTGSLWTRPIPTPSAAVDSEISSLLNSPAARRVPILVYFIGCVLLFTLLWMVLPSRQTHVFYHETWQQRLMWGFPVAVVVSLFVTSIRKK